MSKLLFFIAVLILTTSITFAPEGEGGGTSGDGSSGESSFRTSVHTSCEENLITVSDFRGPIEDVRITIKDISDPINVVFHYTNGSGQVVFPGCDMTVDITLTKSGYNSKTITEELVACESCHPRCVSTSDCSSNEKCVGGDCVAVECISDSQCPQDKICDNNVCKQPECMPPSCCTSDSQCTSTQKCNMPSGSLTGDCEEITVCGKVENHSVVEAYECGGPNCPVCSSPKVCDNYRCADFVISCPASILIGETATCRATADGEPCSNCAYQIQSNGKTVSGTTTADGSIRSPLVFEGTALLTLFKSNQPVAKTNINVLPKPSQSDEKPSTGNILDTLPTYAWLLILVGFGAAIFIYLRTRGQKDRPPSSPPSETPSGVKSTLQTQV